MNTTNTPECNLTLHDPSSHTRDNAGEYAWEYGPFSECSVSCGTGELSSLAHFSILWEEFITQHDGSYTCPAAYRSDISVTVIYN